MEFNECDKVYTLCDKNFKNGFVPAGSEGYVMLVTIKSDKIYLMLEIPGINHDDPLFSYQSTEVRKA